MIFLLVVYSMNYIYTDDSSEISKLSSGDVRKNSYISSPSKSALNFLIMDRFNWIDY